MVGHPKVIPPNFADRVPSNCEEQTYLTNPFQWFATRYNYRICPVIALERDPSAKHKY